MQKKPKQILAYGSGRLTKEFIKYAMALTGKERPKICFIPTASGDDEEYIRRWLVLSKDLNLEPSVLRVWIDSMTHKKSWEEILLPMDAIVVGGGNTLNMMAIWKAQGIDKVLLRAYENGTVMLGGSAGSLCWFNAGTTDSRPQALSVVKGLAFLAYSHCPHYHSEASRIPLYHENIRTGKLSEGYASDDRAGVLFIDGKMEKAVSLDLQNNSYFVHMVDGKVKEEKLAAQILK